MVWSQAGRFWGAAARDTPEWWEQYALEPDEPEYSIPQLLELSGAPDRDVELARTRESYGTERDVNEALGRDGDGSRAPGMLTRLVDTLDAGRSAVFNFGREVFDGEEGIDWDRFSERHEDREAFRDLEWANPDEDANLGVRAGAGLARFLGDVALDPLTYFTGGGSVLGRRLGSQAVANTGRGKAAEFLAGATEETLRRQAGRVAPEELARRVAVPGGADELLEAVGRDVDPLLDLAQRQNLLPDLASEGLSRGMGQAYATGGSARLRRFLTDDAEGRMFGMFPEGPVAGLGREAGEGLWKALPAEFRGGVGFRVPGARFFAATPEGRRLPVRVTVPGTGGGRGLEKLGVGWMHDLSNGARTYLRTHGPGRSLNGLSGMSGQAYGSMLEHTARKLYRGSESDFGRAFGEFEGMDRAFRETRAWSHRLDEQLAVQLDEVEWAWEKGAQEAGVDGGRVRARFNELARDPAEMRRVAFGSEPSDPTEVLARNAARRMLDTEADLYGQLRQLMGDDAPGFLEDHAPRMIAAEARQGQERLAARGRGRGTRYDPEQARVQFVRRWEPDPDDPSQLRPAEWMSVDDINAGRGEAVFVEDAWEAGQDYLSAVRRLARRERLFQALEANGVAARTKVATRTEWDANRAADVANRAALETGRWSDRLSRAEGKQLEELLGELGTEVPKHTRLTWRDVSPGLRIADDGASVVQGADGRWSARLPDGTVLDRPVDPSERWAGSEAVQQGAPARRPTNVVERSGRTRYEFDSSAFGDGAKLSLEVPGSGNLRLTATSDGRQLGTMNWQPGTGKLEGILVEPDFQRQGVATRLLREAEELADAQGVPRPSLEGADFTEDGAAWASSLGVRPELEPTLPRELRDAAPAYREAVPRFESDVDRAVYIVTTAKSTIKSRADQRYLDWLDDLGLDEDAIVARGRELRDDLKARYEPGAELAVPSGGLGRAQAVPDVAPSQTPAAPAPVAPARAVEPPVTFETAKQAEQALNKALTRGRKLARADTLADLRDLQVEELATDGEKLGQVLEEGTRLNTAAEQQHLFDDLIETAGRYLDMNATENGLTRQRQVAGRYQEEAKAGGWASLSAPDQQAVAQSRIDELGLFGPEFLKDAITASYRSRTGQSDFAAWVENVWQPTYQAAKAWMTSGRTTGYIARNVVGGLWNAHLYDVQPVHMRRAAVLTGMKANATRKAKAQLGRNANPRALADAARAQMRADVTSRFGDEAESILRVLDGFENHVLGPASGGARTRGVQRRETDSPIEAAGRLEMGVPPEAETVPDKVLRKATDNGWISFWSARADESETYLRLATFLKGADQFGMDDGGYAAGIGTIATQFDYGDLSGPGMGLVNERNIKNLWTFYTFARYSVPLQFRALLYDPGKVNRLVRSNEELRHMFGDPEAEEEHVQARWTADRMSWFPKGLTTAEGYPMVYGIESPLMDLNRLFLAPDPTLDVKRYINWDEVIDQANPFITQAADTIRGVDSFTRGARPSTQEATGWAKALGLSRTTPDGDEVMSTALRQSAEQFLPPLGMATRLAPGLLGNERGELRQLSSWLSTFGAAPVATLDPYQEAAELRQREMRLERAQEGEVPNLSARRAYVTALLNDVDPAYIAEELRPGERGLFDLDAWRDRDTLAVQRFVARMRDAGVPEEDIDWALYQRLGEDWAPRTDAGQQVRQGNPLSAWYD